MSTFEEGGEVVALPGTDATVRKLREVLTMVQPLIDEESALLRAYALTVTAETRAALDHLGAVPAENLEAQADAG